MEELAYTLIPVSYTHLDVYKSQYMACVDEFQHRVYAEKLTDAMERRKVWHELEKIYLPWRDYDGNEFLGQGGFWMQKQHLFMCPFYYIDYAVSRVGALEYYGKMQEDLEGAWKDYYALCSQGGSKGYHELLRIGNLSDPFKEGTIYNAVSYTHLKQWKTIMHIMMGL